jgi:isoleucyl-tRNA synthetase
VKANFRSLGPRFGKQMPQLAAAVAALDAGVVAAALRSGGTVVVSIAGTDHELGDGDLLLALAPLEGYGLEREGSHAVALELSLDAELIRAGRAREIVHAVQQCRKDSGLDITDRITLVLGGDEELLSTAREHERYIVTETLATDFAAAERDDWLSEVAIDSLALRIWLARS